MASLKDVKYEKLECAAEVVKQVTSSKFSEASFIHPKFLGILAALCVLLYILASFVDGKSINANLLYTQISVDR